MNKIMEAWVRLAYAGMRGSWRKMPADWPKRIADLTNFVLAIPVAAVIMKIGLNLLGEYQEQYQLIVGGFAAFVFYLIMYKIGIPSKYILAFQVHKTHKRNRVKELLSFILIIALAVSTIPLSVLILLFL
ncbi:MAG: hypothetical protein AAF901_12285 [Bacteroidota bacterium]